MEKKKAKSERRVTAYVACGDDGDVTWPGACHEIGSTWILPMPPDKGRSK